LTLDALTPKDIQDLDFIVKYADIINYSFVQTPDDIRLIQREIKARQPQRPVALVAKIETAKAVENLPELIVAAGSQQPFGVMIARGDLAVEIGFERMAEMQEEMLWVCEAAHVPVIWATQVLETLAKTGRPTRAEMTDAAMAERAECVMLNKGKYILEAMKILDSVLVRMQAHQSKKVAQLRALRSW
jgi:pyruvate kinase